MSDQATEYMAWALAMGLQPDSPEAITAFCEAMGLDYDEAIVLEAEIIIRSW